MKLIYTLLTFSLLNPIFANDCEIEITDLNLCAKVEWTDGPYLGAYSKSETLFYTLDENGDEVLTDLPNEFEYKPYIWMIMPSHEHGGRPITVNHLEEGIYENENIFFMGGMRGWWELRLRIVDGLRSVFEHKIKIENYQ